MTSAKVRVSAVRIRQCLKTVIALALSILGVCSVLLSKLSQRASKAKASYARLYPPAVVWKQPQYAHAIVSGGSGSPLLNKITCDFPINHVNASCPRFVKTRFKWNERAGLGDRFFQYIVGLAYALHVDGFLVNADEDLIFESTHGDYSWVLDFFRLNLVNANQTIGSVQNEYGQLNVIERVEEIGGTYEERIAALRQMPCNTLIYVDNDDCFGGWECYFSSKPRIYEHARHIVGCWFLHTDRQALPHLTFDSSWYNVAIHLRAGDITLMSGEKGQRFFTRLKEQLDVVLKDFRVHFHFFAEVPRDESSIHDDQVAPKAFTFLNDVFAVRKQDLRPQRTSYIKNMDVRATLYHNMNADMIITTGSSFPLLAATISPKPVLLFTRSKEGGFYPTQMRSDYASVEETGEILRPTLSELAAHVLTRYLEVHDKSVPYEYAYGDGDAASDT